MGTLLNGKQQLQTQGPSWHPIFSWGHSRVSWRFPAWLSGWSKWDPVVEKRFLRRRKTGTLSASSGDGGQAPFPYISATALGGGGHGGNHPLFLQSPAMQSGLCSTSNQGGEKAKSCAAPRGWEIQLGPFRSPHQLSPPPLSSHGTRRSTRNPPLGRLHSARPLSS